MNYIDKEIVYVKKTGKACCIYVFVTGVERNKCKCYTNLRDEFS